MLMKFSKIFNFLLFICFFSFVKSLPPLRGQPFGSRFQPLISGPDTPGNNLPQPPVQLPPAPQPPIQWPPAPRDPKLFGDIFGANQRPIADGGGRLGGNSTKTPILDRKGNLFQLPGSLKESVLSEKIKDRCSACVALKHLQKCWRQSEIASNAECEPCRMDNENGVECRPKFGELNQALGRDPKALARISQKFDGGFQMITESESSEIVKKMRDAAIKKAEENCVQLSEKDLEKLNTPFYSGDLLLSDDQFNRISVQKPVGSQRRKRKILSQSSKLWQKRQINYYFDSTLSDAESKSVIKEGLSFYENNTCFTFLETSQTEADVVFFSGEGCYSTLGVSTKKPQGISLQAGSCTQYGVVTHEVGHLLGLEHEHARPDRDRYYLVMKENIDPSYLSQYDRCNQNGANCKADVPFDFGSVMAYDGTAFVNDEAKKRDLLAAYPNIPDNSLYLSTVGSSRQGPTFYDMEEINQIYCPAPTCNAALVCQNGGYPHPKLCNQCQCPEAFTGPQCDQLKKGFPQPCGGSLQANDQWQEITSPAYPKAFEPLQECTWSIDAPIGKSVLMEFVAPDFGFPAVTDNGILHCDPNFVEIRFRSDLITTGPRFCGNDVPTRQIKSLTNRAIILMRAPASPSERAKHQIYSGAKGFKLRFKSDEASTEKEEPFVPVNEANAAQYINEPPNSNCCRDSDSLCCSWALSGKCDSDASVKLKCRKACGICGCKTEKCEVKISSTCTKDSSGQGQGSNGGSDDDQVGYAVPPKPGK